MTASASARTAVVICNPVARHAMPRAALEAAARPLEARGWRITLLEATSAAQTAALAAEHASAGIEAVLACGGDGTLLRVVNGVLDARGAGDGATCAVGVVPAGTANVWARETNVPRDAAGALALLEGGARRRVDLGVARLGEGGAPLRFLLSCGAGLDGAVVRAVETHPRWKRRAGRLAYGPGGLVGGVLWPPSAARIEVDGVASTHERLLLALVANTRRYGGVAPIAASARVDDGVLDLVTFEGDAGLAGLARRLAMTAAALRGRLASGEREGVTYRRARRTAIEPARALPVQADGEAIGECGPGVPLLIEVQPRAVTMIVGTGPQALFGEVA